MASDTYNTGHNVRAMNSPSLLVETDPLSVVGNPCILLCVLKAFGLFWYLEMTNIYFIESYYTYTFVTAIKIN